MGRLPRNLGELPRRALAAAALALGACATPPAATVSDGRYAMGTALEITLVAPEGPDARELLARLFERVEALEAEVSTWRPESATSRLNERAGEPPEPVPPDLAELLEAARRFGEDTGGAFDVTVGPLVRVWTEAAARDRVPSASELGEARERVGFRQLTVTDDGRAGLERPGMAIDLGGIAKGFALDRLAPELAREGVSSALLSFGQSSVLALGTPPEGGRWRLGLRGASGEILGVVALSDAALSVSSSLGRSSEIGGVRYGHVVDPRTGEALREGRLAAVTASTATGAEAWSTALLVLGAGGLPLVEAHPGLEALLVEASGARHRTSGFPEDMKIP